MKEERLKSLLKTLDYIKKHNALRLFFDKNGNRQMYKKFEESEETRDFHNQLSFFASLHMPRKLLDSKRPNSTPAVIKMCLKYKTFHKSLASLEENNAIKLTAQDLLKGYDVAESLGTKQVKYQRHEHVVEEAVTEGCS